MLINVINTDGAQPGLRPRSALQSIALRERCVYAYIYCNYLFKDELIFTVGRSLIQNPFNKHQDSHVEK